MTRKYEEPAIGIELGTSNSRVAVWQGQNNRAEIMHNELGYRTTPSFVAFTDDRILIGHAAKSQAASNPSNTIFGNSNFLLFLDSSLYYSAMIYLENYK
jgi:L1 cell adhesion molecule like protein